MKSILCVLLAFSVCGCMTACSNQEVPSPQDQPSTQTTTHSTPTETATETVTQTTTATVTDTQTTEISTVTTVTQATTTTTVAAPTTMPSPFGGLSISKIELYNAQLFQIEEAIFVKTLMKAEIETAVQQLTAATWTYYPNENNWLKSNPIFAEWALILTDINSEQHVLHLFDRTVGWVALGTFEGNDTYADIIAQATANSKKGVEDFKRYKIDTDTLSYLLSLF